MSEKGGGKSLDSEKKDKKGSRTEGALLDRTPIAAPTDSSDPIPKLQYYHGLLPREDMKEILKENGDFLLRNTELVSGEARTYCLSVRWNEEVRHFALQKHANEQNHYCIDGKQYFPTIISMIDHYVRTGQTFTQYQLALYKPAPREFWEILHSQVQLKDKLGTGAFGDVYLGSMIIAGKQCNVAIKTLRCRNQTKEKIEEIMSEARILRKLHHKNIVRCYGVSADIEPLYIVMEFVKGGGLDSYLKKNADKMDLRRRLRILLDVSCAVRFMHKMNVIHRDIAARNCLYDGENVKLSDFGMSRIAKAVKLEATDRSAIRWCAPEAFNKRMVSCASDIWAMGVLFYEVFTDGAQPYTGWSLQNVRDQVSLNRQHLELPMTDGVPKELGELVDQMFAYEEEKRIKAKDVLKKLNDIYKMHVGEDDYYKAHRKYILDIKGRKNKGAASSMGPDPTDQVSGNDSIDQMIISSIRKKKSSRKSAVEGIRSDQKLVDSKRSKKKSRARRKSTVERKDGGSESPSGLYDDKMRKSANKPAIEDSKRKMK